MPPLANEGAAEEPPAAGQNIAVLAETLYLVNLLLLPLAAFLLLLWVYRRHYSHAPPLARCHLLQTLWGSVWAGAMLLLVTLSIILLGGHATVGTWVVVILYFTTVHATLVLFGSLGLARAMAGQHFHFPLIGRQCPGM